MYGEEEWTRKVYVSAFERHGFMARSCISGDSRTCAATVLRSNARKDYKHVNTLFVANNVRVIRTHIRNTICYDG